MKFSNFNFPWITASITGAAVILFLLGSPIYLAWKPGFELWRLFSCHLIHWSADHLLWDASMFLLLGSWCEQTDLKAYILFLVTTAVAIPLVVNIINPGLDYYAGLYGLDMGQAALGVSLLLKTMIKENQKKQAIFLCLLTLGIIAKLIYEFFSQSNFFVSNQHDFMPVPVAHGVGVVVGLMVGLGWRSRSSQNDY